MKKRKIEVVAYSSAWEGLYQQEAEKIQNILGLTLKAIHHIGSTSIPGMSAKPIIDIILECDNLDDIDFIARQLSQLNYLQLSRNIIPHRSFFCRKVEDHISYHLHIFERGDPQIKRHIHFKDYLTCHPEEAKQYEQLKQTLAALCVDDIQQYVVGKSKLVQAIDVKAKLWIHKSKNFFPANTGQFAIQWDQEKVIQAIEANFHTFMTHFSQFIDRIQLIRIPGYTLVNTGLKDISLNCIFEADFTQDNVDQKIAEVTQYMGNSISYTWLLGPYNKPTDLAHQRLNKFGFIHTDNKVGMYLDLNQWRVTQSENNFSIVQVRDIQGLQDFAKVSTNNETAQQYYSWIAEIMTEDDPFEFYVGYINGKPASCGIIVYYAQVAGIYRLATSVGEFSEEYKSATLQFMLHRARKLGYHIVTTQAISSQISLYAKQGFKECQVFKALIRR